jgi:NAD(P)-dependent dehydrogenase (short-subunit alcohol dehydrogenase family)
MSDSLSVLVTGASSGIGAATAELLLAQGHRVYASARRLQSLSLLRAKGCEVLAVDVTDEASMREAVRIIEAREGSLDVLVNNAGYSLSGALEPLPIEEVRRQFETNVFGLLRMSQLVLPGMRRAGRGRIINLSSMGGKMTFPGAGAYHASKHAVEALSDALRFELQGFGVDVVVIQPGPIRSHFGEKAASSMPKAPPYGPFCTFNQAVAESSRDVHRKGILSCLAGEPVDVARLIARVIAVPHPKARYTVTGSARLLLGLKAFLSDAMWDRFVAGTFPRPGNA